MTCQSGDQSWVNQVWDAPAATGPVNWLPTNMRSSYSFAAMA